MSKTRWWLIAGGVVVVLVAAIVLVLRLRAPSDAPQFVTAKVERGSVIGRVTATGTLSALVTVQVGAQVSGRISELHADFNSPVKKGQVLATLDASLFEAAVAQSRANEKAAEGNLARAKAQAADSGRKLARTRQLAEQKLVAQADLEAAQADEEMAVASIQAAEGTLAQARAGRKQAEVNLSYTTITSPIDGTVISRSVDVGQTVAASLSAPTVFTIAQDLTQMQVDTNVAEADVGKLKEGLEATFTVDAFPARRFRGRIRQIRYAPQVVQNVVTYDAVIDVPNQELLLRPGMTANVTFVYAEVDDVLRVPNAALRFRLDERRGGRDAGGARFAGRSGEGPGDGGAPVAMGDRAGRDGGGRWRERGGPGEAATNAERTVYALRGDTPTAVTVRTGVTDGSFTELTSGLEEGEVVIVDKQQGASSPSRSGPPAGGGMRRMF